MAPLISRQTGFTLVELMVVLVVIAVAASMVTMSLSPVAGHALESAAERLSATLEAARWQAISSGRRIAWEAPPSGSTGVQGHWYDQLPNGVWQLRVTPSPPSPPSSEDGVTVSVTLPPPLNQAPARLLLGPEPVGAPACVWLTQAGSTIAVVSDGVAAFSVRRDAHC